MRSVRAPVVCVLAALVMLVALACSNSPTGPSEAALVAPSYAAPNAVMGTEGHTAGPPAFSNAAVVFRGDLGCGLIDGSGNWFPEGWPDEVLPCGTEVATYSKNGNASGTIRASGVPNPTGRTVHWGPYNPGADWAASYPELPGGNGK